MSRGTKQMTIPVVFRDDEIEIHDTLIQSIGNRSYTKWVKERELEHLNSLTERDALLSGWKLRQVEKEVNNEHLNDTENE
jgi:hypothetical protein